MNKLPGCYQHEIDIRDLDYRGVARFVSMCHYILEAAGEDADKNGFGVRNLNHDNCSWVLMRMSVEMYRYPTQDEIFSVCTWVSEINRLMTTRNMTLHDSQGAIIGSAVTLWSIIDLDKRTPLDIRSHVNCESVIIDTPSPIEKPGKIAPVNANRHTTRKAAYSDIDFNRHVNSMKYMEWMLDMIDKSCLDTHRIKRADINFLHEAVYEQVLTVGMESSPEGGSIAFEVVNEEATPLCRAKFTLCEKSC